MTFRKFGEQIAGWNLALDKVVCDDCMDHILRSPLGHVAGKTIRSRRQAGFVNHRLMATLANRDVMRRRVLSTIRLVRIVAGKARHLARTEACRHTQSITGMRDLEAVPLCGGAIEEKFVIAYRFAGPEGIDVAVVAANLVRHQAAAGLEMALHADL